ncbi:MAG: PEP-CTERM sorting domain-containing protein [Cephaloticoccus sp.]|nr:PEP-CTERM sorting domain-containing protein [Cephaloticoccus sp.]
MGPKRILLLTLGILFSAHARSQVSITTFNSAIVDTFTGFDFDGTSVPVNWTISSGETFKGYGTGSSTSTGVWSYGSDATGVNTDRWLGFLFGGSPSNLVTFTKSYINNTGSTISTLLISYDAFQFRSANGGYISYFDVNINGGSSIGALNFTSVNSLPTGVQTPIVATNRSITLSGLSLSDGQTFSLNFVGDRGTGTGSSQGIGLDNISVTAVPEPSTYAAILGAVALLGAVLIRRRRQLIPV